MPERAGLRRAVVLSALAGIAIYALILRSPQRRVRVFTKSPKSQTAAALARVEHLVARLRTPWLFSHSVVQLFILVMHQKLVQKSIKAERRILVSLDNYLDVYQDLASVSERAPVVIYLPGIAGGNAEAMGFVKHVVSNGWIAMVHLRRGHAGPLSEPSFNLFGNAQDLRECILHIETHFPGRPIALVGNSAGTAILVRYLGVFKEDARVAAAVCISAGYDISTHTGVWSRSGFKDSLLDRYLTATLKRFFIANNAALLQAHNADAYNRLVAAPNMQEFQREASEFAHPSPSAPGSRAWDDEEWLRETCPLTVSSGIRVPTLAINAEDDPICHFEFVERHAFNLPVTNEHLALVLTEVGSHCAFLDFEGGPRLKVENYAHRLALGFIDAICFPSQDS